jgi:hypothetical protein
MIHPQPKPTIQRLVEFREFVRVHWDLENLLDAFKDYGDEESLDPDLMRVLAAELQMRRVWSD